jgi:hypothetical protein
MLSPAVRAALRNTRSRLLHVSAGDEVEDETGRSFPADFEAVIFDYTHNRVVRVQGPGGGASLRVSMEKGQPRPSPEEYEDAVSLVAASPVWGDLLRAGHVRAYPTMPPNLEPIGNEEEVERTVFVGLYSRERKFNRIVAVNMLRREVSKKDVVPRTSRANLSLCGPDVAFCNQPSRGTHGSATIVWPKPPADPIWRFKVVRPAASSGTNGSGIDLTSIRYRGQKVLAHLHVPLLNVRYDDDLCGPYRDWLYQESCFDALGTDVKGTKGIRWCDTPPQTIFEKDEDGGNYVGVAVFEADDGSLRLLSICSAGWYRYLTEYRFYPDGRILPRFKFGAVADSCTCNPHHHHAYFRMDWGILGPKNIVDEFQGDTWVPLKTETTRSRQEGQDQRWRVRAEKQELGYEIIPGETDGIGDAWSGPDAYVLRNRPKELDDRHSLTSGAQANLLKYVKNENVYKQDLVTWYVAHFHHVQPEAAALDEHTGEYGPTLQPFGWPG